MEIGPRWHTLAPHPSHKMTNRWGDFNPPHQIPLAFFLQMLIIKQPPSHGKLILQRNFYLYSTFKLSYPHYEHPIKALYEQPQCLHVMEHYLLPRHSNILLCVLSGSQLPYQHHLRHQLLLLPQLQYLLQLQLFLLHLQRYHFQLFYL